MNVKKVAKEQEIWNKKEEATRSEKEVKKLVSEQFHRWIKILEKKTSERMPTRKMWNYAIDLKEEFVPRKQKVYLLFRKEREKVRKYIQK